MEKKLTDLLKAYDNKYSTMLTEDYISSVRNNEYTTEQYINVLTNEWIPVWISELYSDEAEQKRNLLKLGEKLKEI